MLSCVRREVEPLPHWFLSVGKTNCQQSNGLTVTFLTSSCTSGFISPIFDDQIWEVHWFSSIKCMIIFWGGGGGQERVTLSKSMPHTSNYYLYPPPISSCFYETCLNDIRPSPFKYFQENNFFIKFQSGFRKFHSTVTSMLKITNDWLLSMDKGLYTG